MTIPNVPDSYFGVVFSLARLGGAWRIDHRIWDLAAVVGELLMPAADVAWAGLGGECASLWCPDVLGRLR